MYLSQFPGEDEDLIFNACSQTNSQYVNRQQTLKKISIDVEKSKC